MIQLYIDNKFVEQFEDETITLTKRVRNLESIGSVLSDFTKNFTIPATETNNIIFNHYYDISVVNGYNPYVKVNAHIESDTIELFRGVIELISVAFREGEPYTYEIIFYGSTKTLSSIYGEDTLQDVDWSDYHHVTTESNIAESWQGTLQSGVIKYPLFDYHRGVVWGDGVDVPNNINITGRGFSANNLRPAIRLKEMVTKCIEHSGYTFRIESNDLFNDAFTADIYCLPVAQAGRIYNPDIASNYEFKVDKSTGQNIVTPYFTLVDFNNPVSGNVGLAFSIVTDTYTAPHQGQYEFIFEVTVGSWASTGEGVEGSVVYIAEVNGTQGSLLLRLNSVQNSSGTYTKAFTLNLYAGDTLKIKGVSVTGFTSSYQSLECTSAPYGIQGETINLASIMPKVKIVDFLQGVLQTFNAVIVPSSSTAFRIVNIDTWYDSGSIVDWTDYVDIKSIVHNKLIIPKRISFKHKMGTDIASTSFANLNQREFGSMSFTPDVDFTGPEMKIETPFTIIVPQMLNEINDLYETIGTTDLNAPTLIDEDLKPAQNELTLFFMSDNEVYSTNFSYFAAGSSRSTFPFAGTFEEYPSDTNTYSLAFSLEADVNKTIPTKTLYQHFWSRYVARIFAKSSRRVSVSAFIPVSQWLNMDLSNTIRIADYYYKIETIDYNIVTGEAKLSLFTYTPVSVGSISTSGNEVTFPADYIVSSSENLIFADNVLSKMHHTFERSGTNYIDLAPKIVNISNALQTTFIAKRQSVMAYPRHLHLDRSPAGLSVGTDWVIIDNYDSSNSSNNTALNPNLTDGEVTTSVDCWVRIMAKCTWSGNQHIKFAIRLDEVNLKTAEVSANSGAVTMSEVVFFNRNAKIDVAIRKTTGEPHTYTIGCVLEVEQIV